MKKEKLEMVVNREFIQQELDSLNDEQLKQVVAIAHALYFQ
jgi:hypothetical protein